MPLLFPSAYLPEKNEIEREGGGWEELSTFSRLPGTWEEDRKRLSGRKFDENLLKPCYSRLHLSSLCCYWRIITTFYFRKMVCYKSMQNCTNVLFLCTFYLMNKRKFAPGTFILGARADSVTSQCRILLRRDVTIAALLRTRLSPSRIYFKRQGITIILIAVSRFANCQRVYVLSKLN